MTASDGSTAEYTGKDVSYYVVSVDEPKRLNPYIAECEDIIEALGMTFAEGCAFKAIWRKCAARTLGLEKVGYKGGLYDAEKTEYYGARMVAAERRVEPAYKDRAPAALPCNNPVRAFHSDPMPEPAASMEDDGTRMQVIGQNGNDGEHYASFGPFKSVGIIYSQP